jgi:membrane fusion protein, multidrug efflux system
MNTRFPPLPLRDQPAGRHGRGARMALLLGTALLLGATLALVACSKAPPAAPAAAATPVGTTTVVVGPDSPALRLHGVVGSRDELRLSFKVGGVVSRVAVEAGDSVRAGQVLAELDPPEIEAALGQARELEQKAARDLARGEALYKDEVLSLEQVQNLRTQHAVAAAQLRAAGFNREHARIVAPAAGVVLQRIVSAHELVAPGQPVLAVSSGTRGWVLRAAVSDRELLLLKPGQAAQVTIDAAPTQPVAAKVLEVSRAADPATGLFPVQFALEATPLRLASGMVAVAALPTSTGGTFARIPAGALVSAEGDAGHVFVAEGGKAHRRDVRVAFLEGSQVAVREGLKPGEQVITDGAGFLDDGEAITPATTTTTTPAGR